MPPATPIVVRERRLGLSRRLLAELRDRPCRVLSSRPPAPINRLLDRSTDPIGAVVGWPIVVLDHWDESETIGVLARMAPSASAAIVRRTDLSRDAAFRAAGATCLVGPGDDRLLLTHLARLVDEHQELLARCG